MKKLKYFKVYTVDPMIDSWYYQLPYVDVYGFVLKLPSKLSIFILSILYWNKGFSMISNKSLRILRYRYWEK